jgi:hypothetical protein
MSSNLEASIDPLEIAVVKLSPHNSEEGITMSKPALAAAIPAC